MALFKCRPIFEFGNLSFRVIFILKILFDIIKIVGYNKSIRVGALPRTGFYKNII